MKNKIFLSTLMILVLLSATILFSSQNNQKSLSWQSIKLPSGQIAHLGTANNIIQQTQAKTIKQQVNLIFILDASGSMNAELPGSGGKKLAIAKEVLAKVFPKIPTSIKSALWVYGHRYPQKPQNKSCLDIENIFPLGSINVKAYVQKINEISAIGYTPIAESIKRAVKTFPSKEDQYNTIILVSDGEETCGGNPCNIADKFKNEKSAVTIHVVGYDVNEKTREQLNCIAQTSGGVYFDAQDATGLLQSLEKAMEATISETILRVEVQKPNGNKEGEDISLYKTGTNLEQKIGRYLCWKDIAAPPGNYDLVIESLPWILYKNIKIEKKLTTVVRLSLSNLQVKNPDLTSAAFNLYDAQTETRLGYYSNKILIAPGEYYLNVHKINTNPIFLKQGETIEKTLGTIKAISHDGNPSAVTLFTAERVRLGYYSNDILVVPGSYQIAKNKSKSKIIKVGNGEKKEVKLGTVRVLGPDGKAEAVTVFDESDKRLGYYGNDIQLVPGSYKISVRKKKSDLIKLAGGKLIEIKLGAVNLKERFEIYDDLGKRMGSYDGLLHLLPGSYTIKNKKAAFDNVKVVAGKITDLK